MITRSNLAEQLRDYQIRSVYDWVSVSFFSSTSNNITLSRVDVVIFVIWELIILAFLVFSAVSLYFRHMKLAFILVCLTLLLLVCMKITKQVRLARRKKRRMLLPLSMHAYGAWPDAHVASNTYMLFPVVNLPNRNTAEREREMGGDGHSTTYKGVTLHRPKRWHTVTGKGLCAVMWFWVFYRAKQDGPVVLGWRHPWEGHGDHSGDHGHGH